MYMKIHTYMHIVYPNINRRSPSVASYGQDGEVVDIVEMRVDDLQAHKGYPQRPAMWSNIIVNQPPSL